MPPPLSTDRPTDRTTNRDAACTDGRRTDGRTADRDMAPFGPWNPGISSQVPERLLPLCTIFHPEHSFTSATKAAELRDLTGIAPADVVAFRPERLALHELLIRVTADLSVPDGEKIEDLGINFREMVRVILARYVDPEMPRIIAAYETLRQRVATFIESELSGLYPPTAGPGGQPRPATARRWWLGLSARRAARPTPSEATADDVRNRIAGWEAQARTASDATRKAACRAIAKVVSALLVRHGRLWGSRELVASLATDIACNECASEEVGRLIDPLIARAVAGEGFRLLPPQARPVVMNTKGASASGKSTLRPLQKRLAGEIGVEWSEFALISPDIWRKQLLDYGSLGPDYKYAGAFTGEELAIIDQKLDRYVARKAERGAMTHLLIDRFRFDSFAPDSDEPGSNLLTRFGRIVYLFFMITPPAALVERAWKRGLDVGRYKAVDDTLAHAIEAYSGMPQLFFTWIERADKRVHFEFLDNSVPPGEPPRTVAFGWNDTLNVLDVKGMLDIVRYKEIDVGATAPEQLYHDKSARAPQEHATFLAQCVGHFREVNFADQASGRIYLHLEAGIAGWADHGTLHEALRDDDTRAGLAAAVPGAFAHALMDIETPVFVDAEGRREWAQTVGRWHDRSEDLSQRRSRSSL